MHWNIVVPPVFDLHNNVTSPTHKSGNSHDMVITPLDNIDNVETFVQPSVNWSDHYPISISISRGPAHNSAVTRSFKHVRNWSCVNKCNLINLLSNKLHPSGSLDEITDTLY